MVVRQGIVGAARLGFRWHAPCGGVARDWGNQSPDAWAARGESGPLTSRPCGAGLRVQPISKRIFFSEFE
jgi:hypothetical protein